MKSQYKLTVKNMVCPRCISSVEEILKKSEIDYTDVSLGEIMLPSELSQSQRNSLDEELRKVGFELIETRINQLVANIKVQVLDYINKPPEGAKKNLSAHITASIPYDYSYLSDLFSSIEGKSIEQFYITHRIEKVKEYLVYDQLSLTEIAYRSGFSSVHHLSAQFRKVTGLTPSRFRKIGLDKRRSIDSI